MIVVNKKFHGGVLTRDLTLADRISALTSGDYPIQMESGTVNSASAVGYSLDTTNSLTDAGSKVLELKNGGAKLLDITDDGDSITFDLQGFPARDNASDLNIIIPGILGSVNFISIGTMEIDPNLGKFKTSLSSLIFANGTQDVFEASINGLLPSATKTTTLGSASKLWNAIFVADDKPLSMGDSQDLKIKWSGSDASYDVISGAHIFTGGNVNIQEDLFIADTKGVVVGHTAQIDFGAIPEFQVLGTDVADSSVGLGRFSNNNGSGDFRFLKSRGATIGANVIVQDGDRLGRARFQGADGTDFNTTAAEYRVVVDGSPAENDIPGKHIWSTRIRGGSLADRMFLDNEGKLIVYNSISAYGNVDVVKFAAMR